MSRLALFVAAAGVWFGVQPANAVIVFEPSPVPRPCGGDYPRLNAYYVRQLEVLNRYSAQPYGGYPVDPRVSVDLMQHPCGQTEELYWRKADLMPAPAERVGVAPATAAARVRGTILIIPKGMMDRPVRSFEKADAARSLSKAE